MGRFKGKLGYAGALPAALVTLAAANGPSLFDRTSGGMWELRGVQGGNLVARQCIADPAVLARFEHRDGKCTSNVVREQPTSAEVHYSCSGGGFGRTTVTMLTPRSLRVETQGISRGAPFHYIFQARRVGDCAHH